MKFLLSLLFIFAPASRPQIYYFNGKSLRTLKVIELPNVGDKMLRLFARSPYELRSAFIDSSEVRMCLPDTGTTRKLKLKGRWYEIEWNTRLKVGSTRHWIELIDKSGRRDRWNFLTNVEGSMKFNRPGKMDSSVKGVKHENTDAFVDRDCRVRAGTIR